MPRILLERRYWERYRERQRRLAPGVLYAWTVAAGQPGFIDYWPEVPATLPEKMVFAELVRRQINFYFAWYFGDMRVTPNIKEHWRPDFYLPDYRIIIEVFGTYWHTRPGMYEYDLVKGLVYTASGYDYYVLTDQEILDNVATAVDSIPPLKHPVVHGNMHIVSNRPQHPTASIAARLRKWPRVYTSLRARRVRLPGRAITGAKAVRPAPDVDPMFTGLDEVQLEAAQWLEAAYSQLAGYFKEKYG